MNIIAYYIFSHILVLRELVLFAKQFRPRELTPIALWAFYIFLHILQIKSLQRYSPISYTQLQRRVA